MSDNSRPRVTNSFSRWSLEKRKFLTVNVECAFVRWQNLKNAPNSKISTRNLTKNARTRSSTNGGVIFGVHKMYRFCLETRGWKMYREHGSLVRTDNKIEGDTQEVKGRNI